MSGLPEGVCCADGPHCAHRAPHPLDELHEVAFLGRRITDWDPAELQAAIDALTPPSIEDQLREMGIRPYRGTGVFQLRPDAYGRPPVPDSDDSADVTERERDEPGPGAGASGP